MSDISNGIFFDSVSDALLDESACDDVLLTAEMRLHAAKELIEPKPFRIGLHGGPALSRTNDDLPRLEDDVNSLADGVDGPTLLTSRSNCIECDLRSAGCRQGSELHGAAPLQPMKLRRPWTEQYCSSAVTTPGSLGMMRVDSLGRADSPVSSVGTEGSIGSFVTELPPLESLPAIAQSRRSVQSQISAVVKEVAAHYGVPTCAVAFQTAGKTRFVAKQGLDVDEIKLKDEAASGKKSFDLFRHQINRNLPIIIEDASQDNRLKGDELVAGSQGIRFYASAPVLLEGTRSVCNLSIADGVARPDFSLTDASVLVDGAAKVSHLLMMLRSRLADRRSQ